MTRRRARVLMVQPSLNPPGGGNGVACWMLEALKTGYDVTVLTRVAPDLARINDVFGTMLTSADLRVVLAPAPQGPHWSLLRDHRLLAYARRLAREFDLLITANNEGDLGRPGIQYVHYPKFLTRRPDPGLRWYQGAAGVAVYQAACAMLTGFSHARMRRNITVVNSEWTGRLVRARHGIVPVTLYPPVAGTPPEVPWNDRRLAVACVGRIAPEKRLDAVIDIVARVRRDVPALTLRIAGNTDDRAYLATVQALVHTHRDWVRLDLDLPRDRLLAVMANCRFGLHGMHQEHFGMAVAELLRAGVIPFAHNSGGPVEILKADPRLLFDTDEDAVGKLRRLVTDPVLALAMRADLTAVANRFSTDRFVHDVRAFAAGVIETQREARASG